MTARIKRAVAATVLVAALFAATPANAAPYRGIASTPSTRANVAWQLGEEYLFEDVTAKDRRRYLRETECFGDIHGDLNGDGRDNWRDQRTRRYICYLADIGVLNGTNTNSAYPTFSPREPVTRAQAASVFARLLAGRSFPRTASRFDDVSWTTHSGAVEWLASTKPRVVKGMSKHWFGVDQDVTNGQVIKLVDRAAVWAAVNV
jgi:S-layer homology domain